VREFVRIAGPFFGAVKHDAFSMGRRGSEVNIMKFQTDPLPHKLT
jgi:hypothetical protein